MPHTARKEPACSSCKLRQLCMPQRLRGPDLARIDHLVSARERLARGTALFRTGDPFTAVYAIRAGSFKTCTLPDRGRSQVTGFPMPGDFLGLDGIVLGHHAHCAVALEDAEVCVLPFDRLSEASSTLPPLQLHLHRVMSREIVREQGVMLLLGTMRAEERMASFLMTLSQRMRARGFSGSDLVLRMTRDEIGSYLGLQLETVSRTLTRFAQAGMVQVRHRHLRIVEPRLLQGLAPRMAPQARKPAALAQR